MAALEKAHPNPHKKHKHPNISGHDHKGRQGPPGWGENCVPAALTQWPEEESILCLRALGSHSSFPVQLANILKHKPEDCAHLGCTLGMGDHISSKLKLAMSMETRKGQQTLRRRDSCSGLPRPPP